MTRQTQEAVKHRERRAAAVKDKTRAAVKKKAAKKTNGRDARSTGKVPAHADGKSAMVRDRRDQVCLCQGHRVNFMSGAAHMDACGRYECDLCELTEFALRLLGAVHSQSRGFDAAELDRKGFIDSFTDPAHIKKMVRLVEQGAQRFGDELIEAAAIGFTEGR